MLQVASSLLTFFLSPVIWILLLVIAAYFVKKPRTKKYCRIAAWGILLIFSNGLLLTAYARLWQPAPRDVAADAPYSCAILLGGFGSPDVNDNGYFNMTADRFIQAVKLYKMGKIKHILINGGNGKLKNKGFNEGEWVK